MLARVTPRALSALPGVFIVLPTKKSAGGKGGGGGGKAESDPELVGSNVLSVGEGVLLKWMSYHLEQANRVREQASERANERKSGWGLVSMRLLIRHAPLNGVV